MSDIKILAELIAGNPKNIFFTGAGVSTESGIPDYRSAENGLWNRPETQKVTDINGFMENPLLFYRIFSEELYTPFSKALPNKAHKYMAHLEKSGHSLGVITQNIDGLHKMAGSENVYELHGTMSVSSCVSCCRKFSSADVFDKFISDGAEPACDDCGKTIRPDIVFFGESLPEHALSGAFQAAAECTLFIVAGSSLAVMPANMLPRHAKEHGAKLVIINMTETPLDYMADIVINSGTGKVFGELFDIWKKAE